MTSDALPRCAECGTDCELDIDRMRTGLFVTNPGQKGPRALYFNAAASVDFCGAACSLAWAEQTGQVPPRPAYGH